MISVIIPIYNEERILSTDPVRFANLSHHTELIFVDGRSIDRSIEIARRHGKVLQSEKGRAIQMNFGAKQAKNDILLFLHADNIVSPESLENIEKEIQQDGVMGGCLTQRIDKKGLIFRLIEMQGNIRARMTRVFYGDQGIFVRKDIFFHLGGFPDVSIFEDVLFSRKLRREGKTVVLLDKIMASPRRWEKRGIIKTMIMFSTLLAMFKMGFPLERIKALYEDLR